MNKLKLTPKSIAESYGVLVARAELDLSFIVLTLGSAAICFFGFQMNSAAVIVGAMVVAPLLYSVVSIGVASFKKDWKVFFRSIITLFIGLLAAIIIAALINLFFPITQDSEIVSRFSITSLNYFFVAFISGFVCTFATFSPKDIEAIVGIAISVALIPPVVLVGIALTNLDFHFFTRSLVILAINIVGLYLGSFLMFAGLHVLSRKK